MFYILKQAQRVKPWIRADGDKTLRVNYDTLNEKSVVFDVGGYKGQWASDIFSKYRCTIHIFEPVTFFSHEIKKRFIKNKKIIVHDFGLSNNTCKTYISIGGDASSIYKTGKSIQKVKQEDIIYFLHRNKIKKIDLMKINIEGGEYDFLERLLQADYIKNIENIQIQFHDFVKNADARMLNIQKSLSKTHNLTWRYPFVWENWKLKR